MEHKGHGNKHHSRRHEVNYIARTMSVGRFACTAAVADVWVHVCVDVIAHLNETGVQVFCTNSKRLDQRRHALHGRVTETKFSHDLNHHWDFPFVTAIDVSVTDGRTRTACHSPHISRVQVRDRLMFTLIPGPHCCTRVSGSEHKQM